MLNGLTLKNFKSFGEGEQISLKNLSLFSGLNSSGKSSIYQGLLILIQSLEASIFFGETKVPILKVNGDYFEAGKKVEILNNPQNPEVEFHLASAEGHYQLVYRLHKFESNRDDSYHEFILVKYLFVSSLEEQPRIDLELNLISKKWTVKAHRYLNFLDYDSQYLLERMLEEYWKKISPDDPVYKDHFSRTVVFHDVPSVTFINLLPMFFEIPESEVPGCVNEVYLKKIGRHNIQTGIEKNSEKLIKNSKLTLRNVIGVQFCKLISEKNIVEIPAFRGIPERVYRDFQASNPLLGYFPRKTDLVPCNFDFNSDKITFQTLEDSLRYWVVDIFKISSDIKISPVLDDYATEILLTKDKKQISINNMGFGVAQVLPVIYNILAGPKDAFYIVDEPEIHLHPSAQTKLADFFFNMSLCGKQILVETHSDHLINRLIFNILKFKKFSNGCQLSWVERQNGEAKCTDICFDEMGYLINPPAGFLDERRIMAEELSKLRINTLKNG